MATVQLLPTKILLPWKFTYLMVDFILIYPFILVFWLFACFYRSRKCQKFGPLWENNEETSKFQSYFCISHFLCRSSARTRVCFQPARFSRKRKASGRKPGFHFGVRVDLVKGPSLLSYCIRVCVKCIRSHLGLLTTFQIIKSCLSHHDYWMVKLLNF